MLVTQDEDEESIEDGQADKAGEQRGGSLASLGAVSNGLAHGVPVCSSNII